MLRALVLALAALSAASAVALPLVGRPDAEAGGPLPASPELPLEEVVIARPMPVRPELARPAVPRAARPMEPRGSGLAPTTVAPEPELVRMPEPEPSIVVVARPGPTREEPGRLLAETERQRPARNPTVRLAPDLPADARATPAAPAPPTPSGPEGRPRHSQD